MKKTLVALLVASAATSVNAADIYKSDDVTVDFYGQLRQHVEFTNKKDANGNSVDPKIEQGSSRVGVNLTYKALEEGLDVVAKVEYRVGESWELRQHYIGMSSEYGVMTYGKQIPIYGDVYGAEYSYHYGLAPYRGGLDTKENFWQSSAIKYQLDLDNSWVKAQYNLAENNTNAELFEIYAGTTYDSWALHIGGASMTDKVGVKNVESTYFEATAEYLLGKGKVGFTYAYNEDKNKLTDGKVKSNGFHLGAKYEVLQKRRFTAAHNLSTVRMMRLTLLTYT
ncbi:outer membrane protein OmpT [Vibrio metschnikovii CIP 69.14]|uniref:porin n=1 Tax=Vibrio metschnikovii TaxID=28172 RepID=UPI0001B946E3|nr:porin [Vibrio metschnikovii]EEX36854.1 outer membrane protein OmpT [Vibrio metschnikovii CIP 69.14]